MFKEEEDLSRANRNASTLIVGDSDRGMSIVECRDDVGGRSDGNRGEVGRGEKVEVDERSKDEKDEGSLMTGSSYTLDTALNELTSNPRL